MILAGGVMWCGRVLAKRRRNGVAMLPIITKGYNIEGGTAAHTCECLPVTFAFSYNKDHWHILDARDNIMCAERMSSMDEIKGRNK